MKDLGVVRIRVIHWMSMVTVVFFYTISPTSSHVELPLPSLHRQTPSRLATHVQSSSPAQENTEQREARLRQLSIDLLRDAGEEAAKLNDRRSAALIQINAGKALCSVDLERARKFFNSGFEAALEYYRDGKNQLTDPIEVLTAGSRADLCEEIIQVVSHCDAVFGREFTKAFSDEKRRQQSPSAPTKRQVFRLWGGSSNDILLENDLDSAATLLRTNQEVAITEARKVYSKGITRGALIFIWHLAVQDRAAADELYLWLLARIRMEEVPDAGELQILAPYPFGQPFIWVTNGIGGQGAISPPALVARARNPRSEDLLTDWYIETTFFALSRIAAADLSGYQDPASGIGAASYLAEWLKPRVARVRPDLIPAWQYIIEQLSPRLSSQQRSTLFAMSASEEKARKEAGHMFTPQPKNATDRIQDLLRKAENSQQPAERDRYYQEAALEADHLDDLSWALQIMDKISDGEWRQHVGDWIYFNASNRAIARGEMEVARSYALKVKAPDQCAYLFCAIARFALKGKDKTQAADILAEAERQVDKADDSSAKVRGFVSIANLLASFDYTRTLEMLSYAVRTANRLPDYTLEPGKMVRTSKKAQGRTPALTRNSGNFDLGTVMATMATVDFEGALALAQSLESKSFKLTAIIALASSVLNKPKQPEKSSLKQST
ncbi:MAG: hypothetical protein KF868_09465 [Acidobacteria bacterium]|nr:hypothetical protein [Acidobacteriota bacterium]MCW5971587.1 hypothetical protein [Blastocatellales bacterium]